MIHSQNNSEKSPQWTFCEFHLLQFFSFYDEGRLPFDLALHTYFKNHRQLGSKDRKAISDWALDLMRWTELLEGVSWEEKFVYLKKHPIEELLDNPTIPEKKKASMPEFLLERLLEAYGDKAYEIAKISNERAPVTVRTNVLKISREDLMNAFEGVFPTEQSPWGITFEKNQLFHGMELFKKGFFEIQDEGSQLLATLVDIKPGQSFLDYCAGAGGKSLAVAMQMQGKGQLYYHDIREKALGEAKKRLNRAGIQNCQKLNPEAKLKKKMDWVLVDAPCSGTGALRRNPDQKWRIDESFIKDLTGKQRNIFERALSYVKPGGHIVYATCSLLPEENEKQVEHFLKTYSLELVGELFKTLPTKGGMDGFFGAVFQSKDVLK